MSGVTLRAVLLVVALVLYSSIICCIIATETNEEASSQQQGVAQDLELPELRPDVELAGQKIFPKEALFYKLAGLEPSTQYEVKISYPATTPTIFSIDIVSSAYSTGRKLLNTEISKFETDSNGYVLEAPSVGGDVYVKVTAENEGITYYRVAQIEPIVYSIVVETLYWGLPFDAFVIGVLVTSSFLIIGTALIPQLLPFLSTTAKDAKKRSKHMQ